MFLLDVCGLGRLVDWWPRGLGNGGMDWSLKGGQKYQIMLLNHECSPREVSTGDKEFNNLGTRGTDLVLSASSFLSHLWFYSHGINRVTMVTSPETPTSFYHERYRNLSSLTEILWTQMTLTMSLDGKHRACRHSISDSLASGQSHGESRQKESRSSLWLQSCESRVRLLTYRTERWKICFCFKVEMTCHNGSRKWRPLSSS